MIFYPTSSLLNQKSDIKRNSNYIHKITYKFKKKINNKKILIFEMASNYDEYDNALKSGELLNNGRFEIIEKIGQGGFGLVYSAYDNQNRGEK